MRTGGVPSSEIRADGGRLTGAYHLSEDQVAVSTLKRSALPTVRLHSLIEGRGIFRGPIFGRRYVEDAALGEPYVSAKDLVTADVRPPAYLSRSHGELLDDLRLREGMILITCSGMNLGRAIWTRQDLAGLVASHDLIRICPDASVVPPGYLYAFLSGRYGYGFIRKQIYGGNIKHIEPDHIAAMPVPRLGHGLEWDVHELVERASDALNQYGALLRRATSTVFEALGFHDLNDKDWFADEARLGWSHRGFKWRIFRAFNYDPRLNEARNVLESRPHDKLASLVEPASFKGHIVFKRIDCEPEHGRMLVGQRHAFQFRPEGRWISRQSIKGLGLVVPPQTTLIPSHGTLGEGELYCRAVYVTARTAQYAFSGDFYRCIPRRERVQPGFLFAFLRSRLAFRLLRSMSTGSKQQYQHPSMIAAMPIPRLPERTERMIADMVDQASCHYDEALDSEREARQLVERAIEEAA